MNEKLHRIAIVGAGAIGAVTAGWISRAGHDVELVCRNGEQAARIRTHGLHITGIRGKITPSLQVCDSIEAMSPDRTLILLAVKATQMMDAANRLVPLMTPDAVLVSLQNGLCEDALASVVGEDRVIGCVTGWGATMQSANEFEMTSPGEFVIGNIQQKADPRLEPIKNLLTEVVPSRISDNIIGSLYSKLMINACITSVGAICGLTVGEMLIQRSVRNLFIRIMDEALTVARGLDIQVETYGGKLDYYRFLGPTGFWADIRRHVFLMAMGFKYRRIRSSSLQSLERGRKTEVDYLTGYITTNAENLRIDVPVNRRILTLIREIEAGTRPICPDNLSHIP